MRNKILIIQPICPEYRISFFNELSREIGKFTLLHFGPPKFPYHKSIDEVIGRKKTAGNFYWIQDLKNYLKQHSVIIFMNDVHWINLFSAPFYYKKPFIAWGHGKSKSAVINSVRKFQKEHIHSHLVYDSLGKKDLIALGVKSKEVFVAPNTIYIPNSCDTSFEAKDSFIFVGRLQKRKRLDLFLKLFAELKLQEKGLYFNIIGDGNEEKKYLKKIVANLGIESSINFVEGTSDNRVLLKFFRKSFAYVSPGAVGLGVLHSFAFGVPVLTLKDENHGPEFFNIVDNETGLIAEDFDEYCKSVLNILKDHTHIRLGSNAFKHYAEKRQISNMIKGFEKAIDFVTCKHET